MEYVEVRHRCALLALGYRQADTLLARRRTRNQTGHISAALRGAHRPSLPIPASMERRSCQCRPVSHPGAVCASRCSRAMLGSCTRPVRFRGPNFRCSLKEALWTVLGSFLQKHRCGRVNGGRGQVILSAV